MGNRPALDPTKWRALAPPMRSHTPDELADWERPINHVSPYVLRVDAEGRPLAIPPGYPGAGARVSHGYLTPCELEIVRLAGARKRPTPARVYSGAAE